MDARIANADQGGAPPDGGGWVRVCERVDRDGECRRRQEPSCGSSRVPAALPPQEARRIRQGARHTGHATASAKDARDQARDRQALGGHHKLPQGECHADAVVVVS